MPDLNKLVLGYLDAIDFRKQLIGKIVSSNDYEFEAIESLLDLQCNVCSNLNNRKLLFLCDHQVCEGCTNLCSKENIKVCPICGYKGITYSSKTLDSLLNKYLNSKYRNEFSSMVSNGLESVLMGRDPNKNKINPSKHTLYKFINNDSDFICSNAIIKNISSAKTNMTRFKDHKVPCSHFIGILPSNRFLTLEDCYEENESCKLNIININNLNTVKKLNTNLNHIWNDSISISPDGKYVAFDNYGSKIQLLNIENQEDIKKFEIPFKGGGYSMFSPDNQFLVVLRYELIAIYDLKDPNNFKSINLKNFSTSKKPKVTFKNDNLILISDSYGYYFLIDLLKKEILIQSNAKSTFLTNDKKLIVIDNKGLKVTDIYTTKEIYSLEFKDEMVATAEISPNDQFVLITFANGKIKLIDLKSKKINDLHEDEYYSDKDPITFSPDNKYAISSSRGDLLIIDTKTLKHSQLTNGNVTFEKLYFSPTGKFFIAQNSSSHCDLVWNLSKCSVFKDLSTNQSLALLKLNQLGYCQKLENEPHFQKLISSIDPKLKNKIINILKLKRSNDVLKQYLISDLIKLISEYYDFEEDEKQENIKQEFKEEKRSE